MRALVYSIWLTLTLEVQGQNSTAEVPSVSNPIPATVFSQEDGVLQPPDWNLAKCKLFFRI